MNDFLSKLAPMLAALSTAILKAVLEQISELAEALRSLVVRLGRFFLESLRSLWRICHQVEIQVLGIIVDFVLAVAALRSAFAFLLVGVALLYFKLWLIALLYVLFLGIATYRFFQVKPEDVADQQKQHEESRDRWIPRLLWPLRLLVSIALFYASWNYIGWRPNVVASAAETSQGDVGKTFEGFRSFWEAAISSVSGEFLLWASAGLIFVIFSLKTKWWKKEPDGGTGGGMGGGNPPPPPKDEKKGKDQKDVRRIIGVGFLFSLLITVTLCFICQGIEWFHKDVAFPLPILISPVLIMVFFFLQDTPWLGWIGLGLFISSFTVIPAMAYRGWKMRDLFGFLPGEVLVEMGRDIPRGYFVGTITFLLLWFCFSAMSGRMSTGISAPLMGALVFGIWFLLGIFAW